jgi:DNA-binding response OmpR family regulator
MTADMPRILLVDDDPSLLDALALAFGDEGHLVATAVDGAAALAAIERQPPDAVVSDVNMPGIDGFTLCRKLRAAGNGVPIILLTSRDSDIDETLGLELGADDYVAKPFNVRVLLARISALLRRDALRARASSTPALPDERHAPVVLGPLSLDADRLEGRYRGKLLTLTLTEFRLLEALVRRPGLVLSRDRLLEIVRGDDSVVAGRIVDTYVRRLRRKLEVIDPAFDRIETVIGAGYRYKE